MIFDSKLLSSILMLAIYLLLKCLYRWTQRSRSNVENTQLQLGLLLRDLFFDPSPPLFGFRPYFGNHWARSTNQPLCCVAATFSAEQCW